MIKYDAGVKRGKLLVSNLNAQIWDTADKLADITNDLEKKYGDNTLENFANDIGLPYVRLRHYLTTVAAWPEKARRPAFWTANVLNPLEDRHKIVEKKPKLTQLEARRITSDGRGY